VRAAGDRAGVPVVINARTDVFWHAVGSTAERERLATERGIAYRNAGADCVFVPGVADRDTIRRLAAGIPAPLNVLGGIGAPSIAALTTLGVARVSLGSGPMRAGLGLLRRLAAQLAHEGVYDALADAVPYDEVNRLFDRRRTERNRP
jgi:2-methylisocitrate lyase-like PEP mutase family enzyme